MTADADDVLPCAGLSVVEVAAGTSDLGLGLAAGIPGVILADLGASVTRVVLGDAPDIDSHLPWRRAWHRDKSVLHEHDPKAVAATLRRSDIALVYGAESVVEHRGLGYVDLEADNPALVYGRCRPSRTAAGTMADYGLLVEARTGFCNQLAGHRPGPIFVDVRASGSGAALVLTASVLALVRRRIRLGAGGWAETSLYDGMLSTLGCMMGRSERAPDDVERYWEQGSTFPNFMYRCADGELLQVWFGGKGMYASVIEVLGDEPSEEGYYAEQVSGALNARALRWQSLFTSRTRDEWIDRLREAGVACEPVLWPGDVLADPHVGEAGLTVERTDGAHLDVMAATPVAVRPLVLGDGRSESATAVTTEPDDATVSMRTDDRAAPTGDAAAASRSGGLLDGVRVVDFSAFVAGPLAAQVLADLGADVVKVEPPQGEAMRAAAYAVAACQRGKRSLALDISDPAARPVVERLIRSADVVLHNFRVGVAERLGMGADAVAALNPRAVYCHASAFGTSGRRSRFPGNDALMQALSGFERAVGGEANDPIAGTWIPIDMCGGWVAAVGALAGLVAAARTGRGYQVATSLLGAGMLLQSGVVQRDGRPVRHPELDEGQTGYGPGYRIYRGGDGSWFAVVIPAAHLWSRLRSVPGLEAVPERYVPLRGGETDAEARDTEAALERVFGGAPAGEWMAALRAIGVPVEPVAELDRDGFRRAVLDDPVNRQMGRVASYDTADWGWFEQLGPLLRCGPRVGGGPALMLPGVGEHSVPVLTELGFDGGEIAGFVAAGIVHQP
jgi:crotonobetainyl-CoA:carnitine CoA-transferase CaiB-like acyl-CoA transferase